MGVCGAQWFVHIALHIHVTAQEPTLLVSHGTGRLAGPHQGRCAGFLLSYTFGFTRNPLEIFPHQANLSWHCHRQNSPGQPAKHRIFHRISVTRTLKGAVGAKESAAYNKKYRCFSPVQITMAAGVTPNSRPRFRRVRQCSYRHTDCIRYANSA